MDAAAAGLPFETGIRPEDCVDRPSQPVRTPWGEYALHRTDGRFVAAPAWCPHMRGPLWEGTRDGTQLVCPWHAWTYSLEDGRCTWVPAGDQARCEESALTLLQVDQSPQGTLRVLPPPPAGLPG